MTAPGDVPEVADVPDVPEVANRVFGDRLPLAVRFADFLRSAGVERGLVGPREAVRVWDRHLLNSAVLAELIPVGSRIVDVGSGAGLPGIPLALARPDLQIVLLEPMQRRVAFLDEAVSRLDLANVRVVRGRAEDAAVRRELGRTPLVTARAVAPLARLARWCLPLVSPSGQVLAIKGLRAPEEIVAAQPELDACGVSADVREVGAGVIDPVAVVVVLSRVRTHDRRRR